MGKRKSKKKNENVKRKDIHKERARNQQKIPRDDADKEQRRATRLGAVIANMAVFGTLCVFLFKMTISVLNVWSKQGIIYWYLQALFVLALSASLITFFDIVKYVISDLKRHNIINQNYKQYDEVSDEKYMHLLNDFKILIIMLFLVLILVIPLIAIYGKESNKWGTIVIFCEIFFSGVVLVKSWFKSKERAEIKRTIKSVGCKFVKWIFLALVCFVICITFIVNSTATIKIYYNADGTIVICNTSAESYNGLDIEIGNMNGEIIYAESIEKEELLFAREDKYINNKVDGKKIAEGIVIECEWLHWKYILDLKTKINKPGSYYISIIVHQDRKSTLLINSFLVKNEEYIFARDNMEKEY